MRKIRIGILGTSEIAFRRFMPALLKHEKFEYVGLAVASESEWFGIRGSTDTGIPGIENEKARKFVDAYGGSIFQSYESLLQSDIDAVYIPLPPALHFRWAKMALEYDKHVLVEKPSTDQYSLTKELVDIASKKRLALHENYMFIFHNQIASIRNIYQDASFGDIRLYRIAFGFPFRGKQDFRYDKALGGGALLDCGGYTVRFARFLLGDSIRLDTAKLNYTEGIDVDIFGSATFSNERGETAQIAFGMDNTYKNELEIWGNHKRLVANRFFTPPEGYKPTVVIESLDGTVENRTLADDNSFLLSISHFKDCIVDDTARERNYRELLEQSYWVDQIIVQAGKRS